MVPLPKANELFALDCALSPIVIAPFLVALESLPIVITFSCKACALPPNAIELASLAFALLPNAIPSFL